MNHHRTISAASITVDAYGEYRVVLQVGAQACRAIKSVVRAGAGPFVVWDHGDGWAGLVHASAVARRDAGPFGLHQLFTYSPGVEVDVAAGEVRIIGMASFDGEDRLDGTLTPTELSLSDLLAVAGIARELIALTEHPVLPYVLEAA